MPRGSRALFVAAAGLSLLSACTDAPGVAPTPVAQPAADAGYLASPSITRVEVVAGAVTVFGRAQPGARVRLASPEGATIFARSDEGGVWSVKLPAAAGARIFGLSMAVGERSLQAQGYLLITQHNVGVLLRAGAGALTLGGPATRITAVDFDRSGGSIVSGRAPVGTGVRVTVDGKPMGAGPADAEGRFSIGLAGPLSPGRRTVQILGDSFEKSATIDVTSASPLAGGPFRTSDTVSGLRADWMTPGGGVQTTLILD